MVPLAHASPHPKRHLDRFIRFSTAHARDQETHGQADRQTTLQRYQQAASYAAHSDAAR